MNWIDRFDKLDIDSDKIDKGTDCMTVQMVRIWCYKNQGWQNRFLKRYDVINMRFFQKKEIAKIVF